MDLKLLSGQRKTELRLCTMVGATCSMGALNFGIGAFYNYILAVWIVYKLTVSRCRLRISTKSGYFSFFASFLVSIMLSFAASFLVIDLPGRMQLLKLAFKYIMLFGFLSCAYNSYEMKQVRESFLKGMEIGSLIQMIWGYLQIIVYALFRIKLNTVIFSELLHVTVGGNTVRFDHFVGGPNDAVIRMTGLGWEPANFSLIMIVGFILWMKKKKYTIGIFFLFAILLSTSRSGYVAFAGVICYWFLMLFKGKMKMKSRLFAFCLVFMAVACFGILFAGDSLSNRISGILAGLKNITDISDADSSTGVHASYYLNLLNVLKEENILNVIFGCGYFSAGYRFSIFYGNPVSSGLGWNPETDVVTLIVGNGIFGAFIYYFYAVKAIIRNKNNKWAYMVTAVLFEGITYLTIRGSWSMLLVLFALV